VILSQASQQQWFKPVRTKKYRCKLAILANTTTIYAFYTKQSYFGETLIGNCIMLSKQNSLKLSLYSIVLTTDFQGQGIWHSLQNYVIAQYQKTEFSCC